MEVSFARSTTSNIRRGPGTDYQIVRVINEGERYRCFSAKPGDEWVKCYEGQYIYQPLLKFDHPAVVTLIAGTA